MTNFGKENKRGPGPSNEARIRITHPERTLVDGLTAPQYCGGLPEVLHAFTVRAPNAKRLGWILEHQV